MGSHNYLRNQENSVKTFREGPYLRKTSMMRTIKYTLLSNFVPKAFSVTSIQDGGGITEDPKGGWLCDLVVTSDNVRLEIFRVCQVFDKFFRPGIQPMNNNVCNKTEN